MGGGNVITKLAIEVIGVLVTNFERAEAAFAIEQGMRAIDRYKIITCIEHGRALSRCKDQYHANGKVRHGVIKGAR